jgi:hypothetical protein
MTACTGQPQGIGRASGNAFNHNAYKAPSAKMMTCLA